MRHAIDAPRKRNQCGKALRPIRSYLRMLKARSVDTQQGSIDAWNWSDRTVLADHVRDGIFVQTDNLDLPVDAAIGELLPIGIGPDHMERGQNVTVR